MDTVAGEGRWAGGISVLAVTSVYRSLLSAEYLAKRDRCWLSAFFYGYIVMAVPVQKRGWTQHTSNLWNQETTIVSCTPSRFHKTTNLSQA
jgi:hypothetical protein